MQSRCQSLIIKPVLDLAVKRCYNILQEEGVTVHEEQKKKFVQLVKKGFPDLRKTINELQKNVIDSELCITSINTDNELLETIYKKVTYDILGLIFPWNKIVSLLDSESKTLEVFEQKLIKISKN